MSLNKEKILVVDDDVRIRRALKNALSARGYDVLLASNGDEALEIASLEVPSMVILDLSMPGMTGLDVCKELRIWSQVPILVLSVHDKEKDKVSALDLGADDYLTKPFNTGELLARIRAHIRRAKQVPSSVTVFESHGLKVDLSKHQVFREGHEVKLTKTEFSLLQYLIKNSGRVVTYTILLSEVWGHEYEGDTQTLRVHIGNLRKKIEGDPNRPNFILTEPGVGYRFYANND